MKTKCCKIRRKWKHREHVQCVWTQLSNKLSCWQEERERVQIQVNFHILFFSTFHYQCLDKQKEEAFQNQTSSFLKEEKAGSSTRFPWCVQTPYSQSSGGQTGEGMTTSPTGPSLWEPQTVCLTCGPAVWSLPKRLSSSWQHNHQHQGHGGWTAREWTFNELTLSSIWLFTLTTNWAGVLQTLSLWCHLPSCTCFLHHREGEEGNLTRSQRGPSQFWHALWTHHLWWWGQM